MVWSALVPGLLLIALLIAGPAASDTPGSPQPAPQSSGQPAPQASPAAAAISIPDSNSVISLLDAVIAWSRGVDLEQQLVEEPAEVLFISRNRAGVADIVKLAFQYGRAEAAALAALGVAENNKQPPVAAAADDILAHPEIVQNRRAQIQAQVTGFQDQINQLQKQLAAAKKADRAAIGSQLAGLQGQLELAKSRAQFIDAMSDFETGVGGQKGGRSADALSDQIDELERTIPAAGETAPPPASAARSATEAQVTGLIPRARAWFALRDKADLITQRLNGTVYLGKTLAPAVDALHANISRIDSDARALVGQAGAEAGASPATIDARRKEFESLLLRNKLVAGAALPLRELALLLDRYQANLGEWREDVRRRAAAQLYGLVMSAVGLAVVLGFLFAAGMTWRRLAFRYVEDSRRRSQMLQLRNFVISGLIAIVLAFEFVSEAGSLATVIGLGTAGIAVALQDVILSIAGYFRIGGRYGIKVGDWIEVQGVRGEVIDIGLTKLTMMESAVTTNASRAGGCW